jgi:hypothetical protein
MKDGRLRSFSCSLLDDHPHGLRELLATGNHSRLRRGTAGTGSRRTDPTVPQISYLRRSRSWELGGTYRREDLELYQSTTVNTTILLGPIYWALYSRIVSSRCHSLHGDRQSTASPKVPLSRLQSHLDFMESQSRTHRTSISLNKLQFIQLFALKFRL